MKQKSITKNYIYNIIYQVLVIILPIITTPYLSRVLGAENIGIYSYTLSITTYFILIGSLGISMYGQREIAYLQDEKYKRSVLFFEIIIFRSITMFIAIIIFYFCFVANGEYKIYYAILIIELIANCIDISWFFQGLEEFKKTVSRNILVKLISTISIFIFVKTNSDLSKYILIYVLSTFFGNMTLWFYLPKYIQKIKIKDLNIIKHIKPTFSLFVPQIATEVYVVLDKTMLGSLIVDKSESGYYEQAQKVIKILRVILTSFGTVMAPRMAKTFIDNNKEQLRKYMKQAFNLVWILGIPLILGVICISDRFVPLFFGDGYDEVIMLMNVFSLTIVLVGLSNVIGTQYLIPTKKQKQYTISVVVGATIDIILNYILIKYYASLGAVIATVIAELGVTVTQIYLMRKEIKLKDIFANSKKYLFAGIVMFACIYEIKFIISSSVISMCLQVIMGVIIYFGILVLMKDEFLLSLVRRFTKRN